MKVSPLKIALAGANVAWVAVVSWIVFTPQQPDWLSPKEPVSRSTATTLAPLVAMSPTAQALIWQKPVLSPNRHPDAQTGAAKLQSLTGIALSGVMVTADGQWAFLRRQGKPPIRLGLGDFLDGSWELTEVTASSATLTSNGRAQTLSLPVARLPAPSTVPVITLPRAVEP